MCCIHTGGYGEATSWSARDDMPPFNRPWAPVAMGDDISASSAHCDIPKIHANKSLAKNNFQNFFVTELESFQNLFPSELLISQNPSWRLAVRHRHAEFSYNNSYQASLDMSPFQALYGRKCRTPLIWSEVGERSLVGPALIKKAEERVAEICEKLKAAQSSQKSYADKKRREISFNPGDFIYLKVSPIRGTRRFQVHGKLAPRYIGPYQVLK